MNQQAQSRLAGEHSAQRSLVLLFCAVSIWRTVMTRLVPLCGASAWWVALVCLVPGLLIAALLRLTMRLTRIENLMEALRACLGKPGVWAASAVLTVLLLLDGAASMTALMTFFTQGIGTRGTQLTLAVLTGAILLFSLHREGLARAVYFLGWGMLAAELVWGAFLCGEARVDHLFPLYGDGRSVAMQAIMTSLSLFWPLVLLLGVPSCPGGRLRCGTVTALGTVGAILLTTLVVPHELLRQCTSLAGTLLLPVRDVPNAVRIVGQSLMMLAFFLAIGASAQLAAASVCMPLRSRPAWLPYALVGGLILTQAADTTLLWHSLEAIGLWLLVPLLLLALLCLPIALARRNRR